MIKYLKKGFSVIELIVVISIFGIMTSVSMFNYSDHKKTLESTDLAQDIALTIRQAQVYGISSSQKNIGSENFNADIAFSGDSAIDITQDKSIIGVTFFLDENKIILYEDNNRNRSYDNLDRIIDERHILYKNTSILSFVLHDNSGSDIEKEQGRVDIVFERPYPDAIMSYSDNINGSGKTNYGSITINVGSDVSQKSIFINSIGNIVVK